MKYAHEKTPFSAATTRISPNVRPPTSCRNGTRPMIGARAPSAISIDVFGPSLCTTEPAGIPSSAIGTSCAAKISIIRVGEPVVTSTNQGRAR